MKAEEVRKLTDEGIERLEKALRQGKSDALTQFLRAVGQFHRYSFGNVMLIVSQRPDATQVAGFNTWKSLGRFVKKGEKGICIIAPMILRSRDESDGEKKPIVRFRVAHVFDLSQTDGEPLPDIRHYSGDPGEYSARLRSLIEARGIALEYADALGGADGLSRGGSIAIKQGLSPAEEFSVLAHELAHELLHHGEGAIRGSKTQRETEAEAVAFVVSTVVGIDCGSSSSDYIQLYSGDVETLAASLDRIQQAASAILEELAT